MKKIRTKNHPLRAIGSAQPSVWAHVDSLNHLLGWNSGLDISGLKLRLPNGTRQK
jgi:hypothetical protein